MTKIATEGRPVTDAPHQKPVEDAGPGGPPRTLLDHRHSDPGSWSVDRFFVWRQWTGRWCWGIVYLDPDVRRFGRPTYRAYQPTADFPTERDAQLALDAFVARWGVQWP